MRTVLYCTTCRYGSPHFLTVCVRYAFGMRSVWVRDALLPAACLPACTQAGSRYSYQYGTSYHEYSYISRTRTVPGVGRTVLYCTTCTVDTGALISDGMGSGFVRYSFGMPAFLPASLHACRQAVGTCTSTVLHTTSIRTSVVLVPGVGRTVLSVRRCGRDAAIPPTKFVQP